MSIKFKHVAAVAATSLLAAGGLVGITSTQAQAAGASVTVTYAKCTADLTALGAGSLQTGALKFVFSYPAALGKTYKPKATVKIALSASVQTDPSAFEALGVTTTSAYGTATLGIQGGGSLSGTLTSPKAKLAPASKTTGTVSGKAPAKAGSYILTVPKTANIVETLVDGPAPGAKVKVTCTGGKASGSWKLTVKK